MGDEFFQGERAAQSVVVVDHIDIVNLVHILGDDRRKLLSEMEPEDIARKYVDHLDSDEAVDLIQELDEEDRDEVLSHIDDVEQAGDIIDLLK